MSTTETEAPVGVFVSCADTETDVDLLALVDSFQAALAAGDIEAAQNYNTQLAEKLAAAPTVDPVTVRALETDELQELEELQTAALEHARAAKADQVTAALAGTDYWLARAYEDGAVLADDRKAYRDQLRGLFPAIAAAADPAALDAITIPAPPAPPA